MFVQCKEHLIATLKAAGIKSQVITTMKQLKVYENSHVGAVLFDEEELVRSGSKRKFKDERGVKHKRTKDFSRDITFDVIIGEYDQDKAEAVYEEFLRQIGRGLYVDGNYVYIEIIGADWVEKDDSILKAKVAVQVKVKFEGGVYHDTRLYGYGELGITVEKVTGKELFKYGEGIRVGGSAGADHTGDPGDPAGGGE